MKRRIAQVNIQASVEDSQEVEKSARRSPMEDMRTNKKERLERSQRSAARETDKEPSIRLNGGWIPPQASDAYTGTAASLAAFRMKQQQWRLRKATEPQITWQNRCAACPTLSRVLAKRAQRNLEVSSLVQQVEGDRWHDRC